jgi:hypothetical protein
LPRAFCAIDPFVTLDQEGVGELVRSRSNAAARPAQRSQAWHLRRAWRRSRLDRFCHDSASIMCRARPSACRLRVFAAAQANQTYNPCTDEAGKRWTFRRQMTLCHVNEKNYLTIRFLIGKSPLTTGAGNHSELLKDDAKIETA